MGRKSSAVMKTSREYPRPPSGEPRGQQPERLDGNRVVNRELHGARVGVPGRVEHEDATASDHRRGVNDEADAVWRLQPGVEVGDADVAAVLRERQERLDPEPVNQGADRPNRRGHGDRHFAGQQPVVRPQPQVHALERDAAQGAADGDCGLEARVALEGDAPLVGPGETQIEDPRGTRRREAGLRGTRRRRPARPREPTTESCRPRRPPAAAPTGRSRRPVRPRRARGAWRRDPRARRRPRRRAARASPRTGLPPRPCSPLPRASGHGGRRQWPPRPRQTQS